MGLELNRDAGIYCRLSVDDERTGESVSIENQRNILRKYVKEQGWNEIEVYCDDGYSGTNFNRPAVQRMIEDAKSGRINIIVVKDLSRFGRNYIEIGQFTDYLFPQIGCRFIAMNNGIDTVNQSTSNDMMGFLNLFNEFYSRDTSKKVKAVKKACAENGKYLGTYAPLGYRKDPQDKHRLLIDEETAPIVRRIFELRQNGNGHRKIACLLNEEGIPSPGTLYYRRKGKPDNRKVNHLWADSTVASVLRNEVYIGNMVQGKNGTVSYKCKKLVPKPKEDWIRVEGTHEAIIPMEIWDTVTAMDTQQFQRREVTGETPSPFAGLLYCADCGFKMGFQRERDTRRRKDGTCYQRNYFLCGNYRRSGKTACTTHSINEDLLMTLVAADIREKALAVTHDDKAIAERIIRKKAAETDTRLAGYERELRTALTRQPEIERLMMNLYEDRIKGTVPETVFATLMKKYETQQAEIATQIPELKAKIQNGRECCDNAAMWIRHIRKYTAVEVIDDAVLLELVQRIEVGEAQIIDGKRVCNIKIVYRYVGDVDDAVAIAVKGAA
jgi:DNA invertase Pin-like site-specific DNA recombinase